MTTASTQHSLFATPPSPADKSSKQVSEKPSTETQTSEEPERPPITLTTEELIEHIFQSMCKGRRWERERLLGANDQELGRSLGNCWCSGQTIELQFLTEGEPALRAIDAVFKTEILTLSAPEIATHIRRIVGIPQLEEPHSIVSSLTCASAFAAKYFPIYEACWARKCLARLKRPPFPKRA
jgi:hypothetical protein